VLKTSFSYNSICFLLLLGYIVFIPIGPFPVYIVAELRLDVTIGMLLLAFVIIYISKIQLYANIFIATWVFYFFIVFVSAYLSVDTALSFSNAFVMFGYSIIALLVPVIFSNRGDTIRKWFFLFGALVSVVIIYLYIFKGFAQDHRFALGAADMSKGAARVEEVATVDPNMTAAGLLLSLIVYFPNLFEIRRRYSLDFLGILCIISASLVTLSRSAMIGFVFAILFSLLIVFVSAIDFNKRFIRNKKFIILSTLLLVAIPVVVVFGDAMFLAIIDKLSSRMLGGNDDSIRIYLLLNAWDVFVSDTKTILIGSGFMTTNPHNEYMRTLSTMGMLGFIASILFLVSMFYFSVKELACNHRKMFSALSIIIFVMVISLFYGYTKLIWSAWMFLLLLYSESRFSLNDRRGQQNNFLRYRSFFENYKS